jgi:two-component system, NarL family, sensor histidine kinase UhpB
VYDALASRPESLTSGRGRRCHALGGVPRIWSVRLAAGLSRDTSWPAEPATRIEGEPFDVRSYPWYGMPLFWRVFLTNATLLVAAAVALVVTPATVSFPVALTELVVLAAGLAAVIVLNLLLLRRVFQPLRALSTLMRGVDPLKPGARARVETRDRELAELTTAFNEMIDRLETERRESARRALNAQEDERLRVARELHDEVGQRLTAVMLQLDDQVARDEVRAALAEVREISRRLRPEALDDLGLAAALRSLITGLEQRTDLRVDRDIYAPGPLSSEQELVAYRIAQEALTNALRHGNGAQVRVQLRSDDGTTVLIVEDTGPGLAAEAAAGGAGIRGMRERAVLVGAQLDLGAPAGRGMRVRLVLDERLGE